MRREKYVAVMLALMLTTSAWAQTPAQAPAAPPDSPRLTAQKKEAVKGVDEMAKLAQEMVDSVFSFGELGHPGSRDVEVPHRRSSRSSASRCSAAVAASRPRGSPRGDRASR